MAYGIPCVFIVDGVWENRDGMLVSTGNSLTSLTKIRSSHPEVFLVKGVLNICSKFTGEHTCQNVISIKLLCYFIEITLRHEFSPGNLLHFSKHLFLRTPLDGCFWKMIKLTLVCRGILAPWLVKLSFK